MVAEFNEDDEAYLAEQKRHREKFYELIGHCVTLYQSVEDYLDVVFAAALAGDAERASALFSVARGLEAKLNMISAALIGRSDGLAAHWPGLLARVAKAAKARNEIAHAQPVTHGGGVTVVMDPEGHGVVSVRRTAPGWMELRKRTKAGETTRLLDDLFAEYRRTEKLFSNLIGFVKLLKGETAAAHLLDGLRD